MRASTARSRSTGRSARAAYVASGAEFGALPQSPLKSRFATGRLFPGRALMAESDLAALFGRLQHGQDDLQRAHAPAAIVLHGAVLEDGLIHLIQLGHTLVVDAFDGLLVDTVIVVDVEAARRLPNVS